MKNLIVGLSLLVVCISGAAFASTQLLNQADIELQKFDNAQGVAMGSAIESEWPWGSYNQWQCFSVANLNYDCADYDYGTLVPSLRAETELEVFHFDLHVEDRLECHQTLMRWRALIDGGQEVCIFAAHMPDVDMGLDGNKPQSLWYINRVKGVGGYWSLFEESPEFKDRND
jgi:hypothetical protein